MRNPKFIIVINGKGGVGKDTLVEMARKHFSVENISSIDPIKDAALYLGWTGDKSNKARKFLADLKKLVTDFNDYPTVSLITKTITFLKSNSDILFVHIREGEEITKYINNINVLKVTKQNQISTLKSFDSLTSPYDYRIITLLIRRESINNKEYGNTSDDDVENYKYMYTFHNDSPLDDTEYIFLMFLLGIFNEIKDKQPTIPYIDE